MITTRTPQPCDAAKVRLLLTQLGYTASEDEVLARLVLLAEHGNNPVLLAVEEEKVLGLIALHWTPMLFATAPVARITTLVVDDEARGRGVGRVLVEAGAILARQSGCHVLELTTALHRADAQAFYKSIGFTASSLRLHRDLS